MKRVHLLNTAAIVSIVLLGGSALGLKTAINAGGIHLHKRAINPPNGLRFHSLPDQLETWNHLGADPPPLSAEILESLGTQNYISRLYYKKGTLKSDHPEVVELHCAYYTGMIDTVPHVPEQCFVGGGMTLLSQAAYVPLPINLRLFPPDPTVNTDLIEPNIFGVVRRGRTGPSSPTPGVRVRMPFGLDDLTLRVTEYLNVDGSHVFAGYFFIANGWAVSDTLAVRQHAFDLSADYAYYAKVQFTSSTVQSAQELGEAAADLLNEMAPEIMRRVPDWVDVIAGVYPPRGDDAQATTRATRGGKAFEKWKKDFVPPDLPGRKR